MTELTETTFSALRAKAEAATPGPWYRCIYTVKSDNGDITLVYGGTRLRAENNAEYIAAANPTTILEICKALEDAQKVIGDTWFEHGGNFGGDSPVTLPQAMKETLSELATLRAENERLRAERECYINSLVEYNSKAKAAAKACDTDYGEAYYIGQINILSHIYREICGAQKNAHWMPLPPAPETKP